MVDPKNEALVKFRQIGGVSRIRDVDLAEFLEMERPANIRQTIAKYLRDEKLNDSDVFTQRVPIGTMAEKGTPGRKPAEEYWLSEEGALFVASRSEMPRGTQMLRALIAAFEELRRQNGVISHVLTFYFATAPNKLKDRPFRDLIRALLKLRSRDPAKRGIDATLNPPWGPSLASWVYDWSIKAHGQQKHRRFVNPKPTASKPDYDWLTGPGFDACKHVLQTGADFAKVLDSWEDWKYRMELAFGAKVIQMQLPSAPPPKKLSAKKSRTKKNG
jgi:hypothetical protein